MSRQRDDIEPTVDATALTALHERAFDAGDTEPELVLTADQHAIDDPYGPR